MCENKELVVHCRSLKDISVCKESKVICPNKKAFHLDAYRSLASRGGEVGPQMNKFEPVSDDNH